MILEEVRDYLISSIDKLNKTNVFIDIMPDVPVMAVKISRIEGGSVSESGLIRKVIITTTIRHSEYNKGEEIGEEIVIAMSNKGHLTDSIKFCRVVSDLQAYGDTEKNDKLLIISFECTVMATIEE